MKFKTTNPQLKPHFMIDRARSGMDRLWATIYFDENVGYLSIEQFQAAEEDLQRLPDFPDGKHVAEAVMLQALPLENLDFKTETFNVSAGKQQFSNLLHSNTNVVIVRAKTKGNFHQDMWTIVIYLD